MPALFCRYGRVARIPSTYIELALGGVPNWSIQNVLCLPGEAKVYTGRGMQCRFEEIQNVRCSGVSVLHENLSQQTFESNFPGVMLTSMGR